MDLIDEITARVKVAGLKAKVDYRAHGWERGT